MLCTRVGPQRSARGACCSAGSQTPAHRGDASAPLVPGIQLVPCSTYQASIGGRDSGLFIQPQQDVERRTSAHRAETRPLERELAGISRVLLEHDRRRDITGPEDDTILLQRAST
jgi:hypothetical protein